MKEEILELVKKSAALPSVPQVVVRFLEITQDPEFDYQQLVELLGTDPGMTAEILRLANSALFGVTRQITSIRQAMTLLGLRRIRSLVLGRYIVSMIGSSPGPLDISYFWRRSLSTAVLAAKLAHEQLPRMQEEVFIAALLADTGVPVLTEVLGDRYEPVVREYCPGGSDDASVLEQGICGMSHAEVSALVLDHWQLPELIVESVRRHHGEQFDEQQTDSAVIMMAKLIGAAGRIAKHLCEKPDMPKVVETCREAMELVDVAPAALLVMFDEIEQDIEELARVLHVEVIPGSVYRRIAQEIKQELVTASPAEF